MSPRTDRERTYVEAAQKMDLAKKAMNLAQMGMESAEDGMRSATKGFKSAKKKLDKDNARITLEEASRHPKAHGSFGEMGGKATRITQYWYSSTGTPAVRSPHGRSAKSQSSERADTDNAGGRSGPNHDEFSPSLRELQRQYRRSNHSVCPRTAEESLHEPDYYVTERRPSNPNQGSFYHKDPPNRGATSWRTSKGVAMPEFNSSYAQQHSSLGRHSVGEPYTAPSSQEKTSCDPQESRLPNTPPQSRHTTDADLFRGRLDVPVPERSQTRSEQQTSSVGMQRATLRAYKTTRRPSLHRESEIIQPPDQSTTRTGKSSQVTEAFHSSTKAFCSSFVAAKSPHLPSTRDTQRSTGPSDFQPIKPKPQRPRRKKDTLGMPDGPSLEGGW